MVPETCRQYTVYFSLTAALISISAYTAHVTMSCDKQSIEKTRPSDEKHISRTLSWTTLQKDAGTDRYRDGSPA